MAMLKFNGLGAARDCCIRAHRAFVLYRVRPRHALISRLCIGANDAWVDCWLNLWSSNRYILHRSPRLCEAQTDPGQGTGTWVFSENIMTTLHYRGQAYATRKPSDVKACVELTYRHEHYNTCRELVRAEMQEHPSLTYRGVDYSK